MSYCSGRLNNECRLFNRAKRRVSQQDPGPYVVTAVRSLSHLNAAAAQLEEDFVKANQDWVKELEIMVATKVHAFLRSWVICLM